MSQERTPEGPSPRRTPLVRAPTDLTTRLAHTPGEIAATLSPLDELVSRGRLLQKQFSSNDGKQSALNPSVVQKSLRRPARPGHLANMDRAYSAEAASRAPKSPDELPKRPIAFVAHQDRPMSSHPRFSGVPSEGGDRLSVASSAAMRSEGDLAVPKFRGQIPRHDSRHEFVSGYGNSRQNSHHSIAPSIASTFDFGFEEKEKPKFERTDSGHESLDVETRSGDRLTPDMGSVRRARSATPEGRSHTPVMQSTPQRQNLGPGYAQSPNWNGSQPQLQRQGSGQDNDMYRRSPGPSRQNSGEAYRRSPAPPSRQHSGDNHWGRREPEGNSQFILSGTDSVRAVSPDQMESSPLDYRPPQRPWASGQSNTRPSSPNQRDSDYLNPPRGVRPVSSTGNLSRNASMDTLPTPREYNTPERADSLPTPVSISEDPQTPNPLDSDPLDPDRPAPSYIYSRFALPRGRKLDKRESLTFKESLKSFLGSDQLPASLQSGNGNAGTAAPPPTSTTETFSPQRQPGPAAGVKPPSPKSPARPKTSYNTQSTRSFSYSKGSSEAEDISAILRQTKLPPTRIAGPGSSINSPAGPSTPTQPGTSLSDDPRPAAQLTAEEHVTLGIDLHERGSLQESAYHLRLAANAGHPTGMLMFALACRHGWGMKPNMRDGVEWLRKVTQLASSDLLESNEQTNTHLSYLEQKGRKAQFALSIYELGISHMNGWGTEQDKGLALRCFEIAGKWGDADALTEAGYCYANGVGCKKDLKKSAWYYRQAESRGANMVGNSWIWKDKYLTEEEKRARDSKKSKDKEKAGIKDKDGKGDANGDGHKEREKEKERHGLFHRKKDKS